MKMMLDTFAGQQNRFTIPGFENLLRRIAFVRCANDIDEFLCNWDHTSPDAVKLTSQLSPKMELLDQEVINELVLLCNRAGYSKITVTCDNGVGWTFKFQP